MNIRTLAGPLAITGLSLLAAGAFADASSTGKAPAAAEQTAEQSANGVQDIWIDARLETAYLFNRHLNNFDIQTDVEGGAVLLTGTVRSDIDKDLAGEIARSLDGVTSVENQLVVKSAVESAPGRKDADFGQKVDDATTTAVVKTRLVANKNLSGLAIDVDTENAVVTLQGDVETAAEKQLAGLVAKNTPEVRAVSNKLKIRGSSDAS